jgi:tetratricopeptide (TPR) repeat protein
MRLLPVARPDLTQLEEAVALQIEGAHGSVEALLARDAPERSVLAASFGELGMLYHAYEIREPAEACYRNAATLAPGEFRWLYYLAYLYRGAGRLEESLEAYTDASRIRPRHVPTLVRLGQVCLDLNRAEAAEAALRRAVELDPASAPALAALGQIALSRKEYAPAVQIFESALGLAPAATRLHYPLALAYRGVGDAERAREHIAKRGRKGIKPSDPLIEELESLPTGERVYLVRGRLAFLAGDYPGAASAFRKAVAAAPGSARAHVNLGSALGALGETEAAMREYREALESDPGNETAHFNLGYLNARSGQPARAIPYLEAAARINPHDPQTRLVLAESLATLERSGEALGHYEAVLAIKSDDQDARIGEATMLIQLGRYEDALRELEEGYALMPHAGRMAHALARFLAGCPQRTLRDGARALPLALRVVQARWTTTHLETVAMALAENGRCEEAAKWQGVAVDSARAAGQQERAENLTRTAAHYQRRRPCRPE